MMPLDADGVPLVAVVVLNFRGWRDTLACVHSVLDAGSTRARVIVVVCENGSPDDSLQRLQSLLPAENPNRSMTRLTRPEVTTLEADARALRMADIVLIDNQCNLGFAGGCNVGIRWAQAAGADFVWLLNNDTEVMPGTLDALLAHMQQDPRIGLCGSKLVYHDARDTIQARGGAVFDPRQAIGQHLGVGEPLNAPEDPAAIESTMNYVVGASMLVSRTFLQRVGPMTEDYFLFYEELDWAMRGQREGFRLGYAPGSVVLHKEGATIGTSHRGRSSPLAMRLLSFNRLLFTRRFYPEHLGSVRRRMALEVLVFVKRREWASAWALLRALAGVRPALPQQQAA